MSSPSWCSGACATSWPCGTCPRCSPCAASCSAMRPSGTGKPSSPPALAEDLRQRRRGKVARRWFVDEMDLKVHGPWCYLYRAIGRTGTLVDVLFNEPRDMAAAQAFFRPPPAVTGVTPDRVTTDGHD